MRFPGLIAACLAVPCALAPVRTETSAASVGGTPLTSDQERGLKPKDRFRECENCPEMVVVPAGSFTMGAPNSEKDRSSAEGPQHEVTIRQPFAAGQLHVTVDEYSAYVQETGYEASSTCLTFEDGKYEARAGRSWRNPGFAQDGSHPVVCVSWDDARAYVDWIAKKTRKPYRPAVGGGVRVCSARPDLTWHVSTLLVRRRRKGSVPERQWWRSEGQGQPPGSDLDDCTVDGGM